MGKSAPVDGHSRCLAVDHSRNTDPQPRLGGTSKWSSLTWVLGKIADECNSIITNGKILIKYNDYVRLAVVGTDLL